MEALPSEIMEEILSRLPAESLLCLKTVCKSWNSIIKTPSFIKSHLNQTLISNSHRRLLKSPKIMDYSKERKLSFYSAEIDSDSPTTDRRLSFSMLNHSLDAYSYTQVFGSCNGVVSICDYSRTNVLLYNPFTKSRRILPAERLPPGYKSERSRLLYGFGYDSKTDDYKVLRIAQGYRSLVYPFYETDHICSVYSLNNNCWKSIHEIVSKQYYYFPYPYSHGVLANETLHYLVMSNISYELDDLKRPGRMIVCFDLRMESFSLMDCPNHKDENDNNNNNSNSNNNNLMIRSCKSSYLAELDGCLCFMFVYFSMNDYTREPPEFVRADVLVMKEYRNKESWSKVYSISDDQLRIVSYRSFTRVKPVVYSKDRRRILIDIDGGFVTGWFDLETKKFEELERHGLPDEYFDTRYFMGSLVSVGHSN